MWSAPGIAVEPAVEPVLLPGAKEFLRIDADDATFDGEIDSLIAAVRDDVERMTGTRLISQTVELRADCFADLTHLPIGPVQSIDEVTYLDSTGVEQTLDADGYELFGSGLQQEFAPPSG